MSGTNAAAVKVRLVGSESLLRGLPDIQDVQVFYDAPAGDKAPREYICGVGDVEGEPDLAAMRGGNGRNPRTEDLSMTIEIRVYKPGQPTREAGDLRAAEIATAVINWITANPKLGDLPELKLAKVTKVDLRGGLDDDGATSSVVITIGLLSFLS